MERSAPNRENQYQQQQVKRTKQPEAERVPGLSIQLAEHVLHRISVLNLTDATHGFAKLYRGRFESPALRQRVLLVTYLNSSDAQHDSRRVVGAAAAVRFLKPPQARLPGVVLSKQALH